MVLTIAEIGRMNLIAHRISGLVRLIASPVNPIIDAYHNITHVTMIETVLMAVMN